MTRRGRGCTGASGARAGSCGPRGTRRSELIAAAHVHTIKRYGPDRVVGFSPIPAMSMASYAAGAAVPVVDRRGDPVVLRLVCGSAAGFAAGVRRSDRRAGVGRLVERRLSDRSGGRTCRRRGPRTRISWSRRATAARRSWSSRRTTRSTRSSPIDWLAAEPGSDGALAMAMGHVILKEFYVDRQVPYFRDYARRFTDLPLLVTLRERDDGVRGRPAAARLRPRGDGGETEHAEWKPVVLDERTGEPAVPDGSVGPSLRREPGRWNLRLDGIEPALTLLGPRERAGRGRPAALRRRRGRGRRDRAPRRAGDAGRRAARDDGARPACSRSTASRATGCRASGRRATTTPSAVHAGVAGADHRRSIATWPRRWRASSRATPS